MPKLTREDKVAITIRAIETQPYNIGSVYLYDKEIENIAGDNLNRTLKDFVDNTHIEEDREDLFFHVANRIIDALEKAEGENES